LTDRIKERGGGDERVGGVLEKTGEKGEGRERERGDV